MTAFQTRPTEGLRAVPEDLKVAIREVVSPDFQKTDLGQSVIMSLESIARLPGDGQSTNLHREIFGGAPSGRLYLEWFLARVKRIEYSESTDTAATRRRVLGPFRIANGIEDQTIFIGHNYGYKSRALQMSILIHEARHIEGFNHSSDGLNRDTIYNDPEIPNPNNCARKSSALDPKGLGAFSAELVFLSAVAPHLTNPRAGIFEKWEEVEGNVVINSSPRPVDFSMDHLVSEIRNLMAYIIDPADRARLTDELELRGLLTRVKTYNQSSRCTPR